MVRSYLMERWQRAYRRRALIGSLFAAVVLMMMGPLAPDDALPHQHDLVNHVGHVVQAGMAIQEGQFPLRVARVVNDDYGYPKFQFYSQLPYLVAGPLYLAIGNPFTAYKWTAGLFLFLGGIYLYRLSYWLTRTRWPSILAGVIYLTSPYVLANLHVRGAFTEMIAQGILPVLLYYLARWMVSGRWRWFWPACVAWFALAVTHTITLAYLPLFLGVLYVTGRFWTWKALKRLARVALCGLTTLPLAMFMLGAIWQADFLLMRRSFWNPMKSAVLTNLSSLLTPGFVPHEPHFLHPAVGLPIVLAIGVLIVALCHRKCLSPWTPHVPCALLALFAVALFVTWSPVDLWQYLPTSAWMVQFTYRFLTHVCWAGALLAAYALSQIVPKWDAKQAVIGLALLLLAFGQRSLPIKADEHKIDDLIAKPIATYGAWNYLIAPDAVTPLKPDEWMDVDTVRPLLTRCAAGWRGRIAVNKPTLIELPLLYYPRFMDVRVDGMKADHGPIQHGKYILTAVHVSEGSHEIRASFRGLGWAQHTSVIAWMLFLCAWIVERLWRRRKPISNSLERHRWQHMISLSPVSQTEHASS